jgi:acyl carrier protein
LALEDDLKRLIIEELKIEDIKPEDIDSSAPLFGDGLGLDSLDAVELVVILKKTYKINLEDIEKAREAFASIDTLAAFIRENTGME